ncbi:MAG: amidohydrolase family protein, partial [Pseudomonadales bacterium]|nr:amidohydrolase family protein [Pseudomonadales bacterium]
MPQTIDTLISSRWMIPVIPENTVLEHHSIAIKGDIIEAILPTQDALSQLSWSNHIDLGEQLLIPGLVNCHGHAAMSLLRGYADDLALMDWLENHIWPAEAKWVGEAFVYDGTSLAIAEMLRSGTTTFSDMYFFPEAAAKAVQHAGLRAQLSFPIFEFPSNWGENAEDYINKGMRLMDQYSSSNKIHVIFG